MTKPISILLMDEDAQTLEQLQTVLRREGYSVLVAVDGHAALRLARTARPNLIVSDLLLQGLDGYEVWKTLRTDKEFGNVPILVISSLAIPPRNETWRPNPQAEWQILSYDAFLPKPVDLRRFIRVVRKLLQPDQAAVIPGGSSVVIAVEDKALRDDIAGILHQQDFGVETPPSLNDALRLIRAVPPAALILDYRARDPGVRSLAQQAGRFAPATVILLVVDPTQDAELDWKDWADCFLPAPIQPVFTLAAINQTLNLLNLQRRMEALSSQMVGMSRDLLDTRQALLAQNEELQLTNARLRELDSLKEALTGMVVHDLKTPLAAVLGALSFLATNPNVKMPANFENLLSGATAAGNQLLRLTETMLEGQRLEEGRIKPDKEPFDIETLIDVSIQQVSPLLTLHRLKVEVAIAEHLPEVYADPHISRRVLENLLDNAIKFSPPTKTITIRAVLAGDFIRLSVEDEGPGIPPDQQAEIFNRFAQLKNPNQISRAGFGLGLAFCQLATTAMGGNIWVESDGESGTAFLFTLPIYHD